MLVNNELAKSTQIARTRRHGVLLTILLIAAALRFSDLAANPPGIHPDEAANTWNAECLFRSGTDFAGESWPIFSMRALGENRSTLFVYVLLPFQAMLGMSEWSARVPNAVAGLSCVYLMFWLCRRLFDYETGLTAAAFIAVMPWSVHLSRWGHEGALAPLLAIVPIAGIVWTVQSAGRAAIGRAFVAGVLAAVCCYGYPAARLFIPPFVLLCLGAVAFSRDSLVRLSGRGRAIVLIVYAAGFAALLAPLAWQHIANAGQMNRRAERLWNWGAADSVATRIGNVASRYADHFSYDFLFASGDHYEAAWSSGFGVLPVVFLPVLLTGAVCLLLEAFRGRLAARLILVWLACYPLGDILTRHMSAHILRASPGIGALAIVAAFGAVWCVRELKRRRLPTIRFAAIAGFCLLGIQELWRFGSHYYLTRPGEAPMRQVFMADLVEACAWIRPRLGGFDAVYFSPTDVDVPYVVTAVALRYDPRDWFASPREVDTAGEWDRYYRYGNICFLYDLLAEAAIRESPPSWKRLLLVVRAGEEPEGEILHRVRSTAGHLDLLIIEVNRE